MQPEEAPVNSVLPEEEGRSRRRWELLLLLLALLLSCGCVFCSTQLALLLWPDRLASASMLASRQADYSTGSGEIQFAVLDPLIASQAATDIARLQVTPAGVEDNPGFTISLLPGTPTPTAKSGPPPSLPEMTRQATVPSSPPASPVPTANGTPTIVPGGSPTPINSATPPFPPTLTPVSTATLVPPTVTAPPTATLPPLLLTPTSSPVSPTPSPTPVTPTSTPGSNPTHAPPTSTHTPTSFQITGRIFEDTNYSGGAGTGFGGGDTGLANVQVEVYNSGNVLINSTVTDASGNYLFTVLGGSSYVVRVVSASIGDGNTPPAAGFNGGFSGAIAEQTYEYNGVSGNGGAGALGGNNALTSDLGVGTGAGPGDTNVSVTVGNAHVMGVDFGFAYNLIVNTQDSGQGSLRQFILNANAIAGSASSQFNIPPTDPNYNSIIAGAFVIRPASALPGLTDNATAIDGTTQETNQGDFRSGLPDIIIDGVSAGGNANGLTISSNGNIIRRLDIRNFNVGNGTGIVVDGGDNNSLIENYLTLNTNHSGSMGAIHFLNTTDANIISNNTIIGNFSDGLTIISGSGNQVINNISTNNGQDGFQLGGTSMTVNGNTAQANDPTNPLGCGIEFYTGLMNSVIANNVSIGNGGEGGICFLDVASSNNTIGPNNTITGNTGPGISSPEAGSVNNRITQNSISANGGLGIDLGGNSIALPVISGATLSGSDLIITGTAGLNTEIEFFVVDNPPDASGGGEGLTFIGSNTVTALPFTFTFPVGSLGLVPNNSQITATATDSSGNTSEFAQNFVVN